MTTRFSTAARHGALGLAVALLASVGVVATTAAPSGAALPACTKTWTNATGGSWDTAGNWTGNSLPTSTDHVCIANAGTYTVTLGEPGLAVTVASLRVGTPSGAGTQTLLVDRGVQTDATSLTATQGIEITLSGALVLGESPLANVSVGVGDGATIANGGAIGQQVGVTKTGSIRGDVVNTGNFRLDAPIVVEGDFTNDGLLQDNHVLHVAGVMWTKGGTISGEWAIVAHGGLRVGDAVIGSPGVRPVFSVDGGELSIESEQPIEVTVYDEVSLDGDTAPGQNIDLQTQDGGDTALTFTGTWTNRGLIDLQPGADADVAIVGSGAGATLVNEGELGRFEDGPSDALVDADLVNRGLVDTNDGIIGVDGDIEGEGDVDLGLGQLQATGDLTLEPGSIVYQGIDGSDAGRFTVAGVVALDGLLEISTEAAPAVGASTNVVTAGNRTGTFDELVFFGPASYDPQYGPSQVNLVRRASESTTRRFVRAAFQDFLDRQPDSKELSNLSATIDGGTLTRATLVRNLSRSPEYVTALVQRFYADTLGRPGGPAETAFWVDQLRTGRRTVAEVAGSFYASPEYFERAGGTNGDWIDDLYGVFFERAPSAGDRTYWVGRTQALGRTRVAIELFQSLESRRQRVQRLYEDLLHRHGDSDGVDYWAARLTREGDLALAVNLASSSEYVTVAQQRYP